jgi:hypothetical protein
MRINFALYEHTCLGFPHVKLKWVMENGRWSTPYVTVKDIIRPDLGWSWREQHPPAWASEEMKRFDDWVRDIFHNDITVQG